MMTKLSIADLESSNVFLVNNMTDFTQTIEDVY